MYAHFITFPVASTNIFPLSNSTNGGQLVTEYNLKSREMVATNPEIRYSVGPSFTHSLRDFKVKLLEDTDVSDYDATKTYTRGEYCRHDNDTFVCIVDIPVPEVFNSEHWVSTAISSSILQIDPGRAVINGHFVESLVPMTIDLKVVNAELSRDGKPPLSGNLSIGIRSYFSTEATMAGAMLVENSDNMYVGIQLVIAPMLEFKTPNDCPEESQRDAVVADLKLADFTYVGGVIYSSSIVPNKDATRYLPSDRIFDFDNLLDEKYISAKNLTDRMFYTYTGKSGWCNSTDSIMVWDHEYQMTTTPPAIVEATFATDTSGNVHLMVPHKELDGDIRNDNGDKLYFPVRDMPLPTADYATGSSGIVTAAYTRHIKEIAAVINTYKQFTNGKQITYLDTLTRAGDGSLSYTFPTDLTNFDVGDYILVREDYSATGYESSVGAPSTMYVVLPGGVTALDPSQMTTTRPVGIRLGNPVAWWSGSGHAEPTTEYPDNETLLDLFAYTSYRGTTADYFELVYHDDTDTTQTSYYYPVAATGPKGWSDAILLTGGMPLATEYQVGGFYNATLDAAYADAGYVYMDDTGHLRLRDYALLRSGTLAYQLGDDFRIPANQTLEYIQAYLDEQVNARVVFRTNATPMSVPDMIHIYIPLSEESGVLNIYGLDSRFGTGVYVHFTVDDRTKDYSNIIINISDCEKIRIDSSITAIAKGPVINLFRSCLYYDAGVIGYIRDCDQHNSRSTLFEDTMEFTGFEGLTLWYAQFDPSDPDLLINGMEISQPNVAMTPQDIAFWDENINNDNHFSYALRSITLSGSGRLVACSLYISNNSTQTINPDLHIIIGGDFIIPQGAELNYPLPCVDRPIKVTGTFTTAYLDVGDTNWIVTETSFTALSGVYSSSTGMGVGSIAFNSSTSLVPIAYSNVSETIGGWAPGTYHIFYGGTTV